jgi:tetratricopeptide (TPR) repeat protein
MKKIMFIALLFLLSLMVCLTFPGCLGGLDDIKAGNAAAAGGDYDKAIRLYTKAIEINPQYADAYYGRGNSWKKRVTMTRPLPTTPRP